jgi:hypothetical protein
MSEQVWTKEKGHHKHYWDKEQQCKAQNSDSKYRQMALTGFDT